VTDGPWQADAAYLAEDARDRRAALQAVSPLLYIGSEPGLALEFAELAYRWLQRRDSLRAVSLVITAGTPRREGEPAMTATFDLSDTDQVDFTLTGQDAKGASVPLQAGYTAAWSLADPDSSGATLTVSADTTTATVAAGVPDTNLMLSVTVTNPDGSTLQGAEAIIVQATAATTVGLVAGTPTAEPPAAG
jgi:hypothetical protein